jgi:Ca2+-binding RTX toxin-like protein
VAVITIKQFAAVTFDLYSTVDAILVGTAISGDGDSATLQLPGGQTLDVVGSGFTYDGSNLLVTGAVTSLTLRAGGGSKIIEGSGFALDVATARANPGNTPLDANPVYHYDASAVPPDMGWGIEFNAAFGNDTIIGTQGHDDLTGFEGNDSILGLGGEDSLWGGLGNDILRGGNGDDEIFGGANDDALFGDADDDRIMGSSGRDTIDGGSGRDLADYRDAIVKVEVKLNGSSQAWVKVGGSVEDSIRNIEGVYGGSKGDKLTGDSNINSFMGGGGKDTIDGGSKGDMSLYFDKAAKVEVTLNGSSQVSVKVGGKVEDKIKNIEHVIGGTAGDKLTGDSKGNILAGDDGKDKLYGRSGKDTLDGGNGLDTLEGGSGSDIFWFASPVVASNRDTIKDFGGSDFIGLDDFYFSKLGLTVTSSEFRKGTAAKDANDYLVYDKKTGSLYYDADGNGAGAQIKIAVLSNKANLSAGDFDIV